MKILLFANNRVGWHVAEWLQTAGEQIIGLVLHPPERQRYGNEIRNALELPPEDIFDGSRLQEPAVLAAIQELQPDIGISALFGYILQPALIELLPYGCINLHPALLPYNRGAYTNVWSIVEGTPAGATIHYIDEGIDTGDIISQRQVPVTATETGATLYAKLEAATLDLFYATWPLIRAGKHQRTPQPREAGTTHRTRDVERIDEIDLDHTYTARELINILRARTFPPYRGAYFRDGNRKIYMGLQLDEGPAE